MQNKILMIVFLLLMGYSVQAQLTDEPIDGGGGTTKYYYDGDRDGYGNPNSAYVTTPTTNYVPNNTDCNDGSAAINPTTRWYRDVDGDGRGRTSPIKIQCTKPSGYVLYNDDRDDNNQYITHIAPRYFYRDADNDTFGNSNNRTYRSVRPGGYVTNNLDCNDGNAVANPNRVWYRDADGDGRGNANSTTRSCTQPSGYVSNNDDINDGNEYITNIPPRYFYKDGDTDTFGSPAAATRVYRSVRPSGYVTNNSDCDDGNINIHPNTVWYKDGDGDQRGNASITKTQCGQPLGYVLTSDDIDDGNEFITNIPPKNFYRDADNDTFGNPNIKYYQSFPPSDGYSYVTNGNDRNDSTEFITNIAPKNFYRDVDTDTYGDPNARFYYSAAPTDGYAYVLNGDDYNDNDEYITNVAPKHFYRDVDTDTFGDPNAHFYRSAAPSDGYSYVLNGNDCNDNNPNIHPNTVWYRDGDNDGFGDPGDSQTGCAQPTGYVTDNTDQCPGVYGEEMGCTGIPHSLSLSDTESYVFTRTYQTPMSSPNEIQVNSDVIETVTYFDGLGRPKQQTAIKGSPTQKDIITHMEYDEIGRQAKQYLPFAKANNGSYTTVDITTDINQYYLDTYAADFAGITNPAQVNAYSETIFEDSPLNRTLEQGAPGKDWKVDANSDADHTIKFDWRHNTANEVVRFDVDFTNNDTEAPVLTQNGYYATNELYVSITKDENWTQADGDNHTTREYKDKQGRVLLKRTFASTSSATAEAHDTYYVYDDFGNLSFVLPPKVTVTDGVSNTELAELCYQYKYDYRNRLVEKKIPGKGWEYIVYNKLDQPVMTQDANLRSKNQWLFTKYDRHGRVAYTGLIGNSSGRIPMQESANNTIVYTQHESKQSSAQTIAGTALHYSNNAIPQGIAEIHTINYYDDYNFDGHGMDKPASVYGVTTTDQVRSLPTGIKVRVLDTNNWITTVTAYDNKGRAIWIGSRNHYLSTIDKTSIKLDFTGRVEETTTSHVKNGSTPLITVDTFTYDHTGRLLTQTQKINDQDVELIVNNAYDELGQLVSKKVGGLPSTEVTRSAGLQTVDYTYNIRGWLKTINDPNNLGDDLFAFGVNYNTTTENLYASKLYNGNISETIWRTANDNTKRAYGYRYDALNRFVAATDNDNKYVVSSVTYDKMGNIESLARNGWQNGASYGNMDVLAYDYDSGNKLLKVTDTGNDNYGFKDGTNTNDDFEYDDNGNMIIDRNKGISSITYNHLNLPETVSISNSEGTGTIAYIYDAMGTKLKKIITEGATTVNTEYANTFVYENGQLQFFANQEGYTTPQGDKFRYVYQYKDHLGNVRLSYTKNETDDLEIVEESNYYPFGLTHKGYNNIVSSLGNDTAQRWKFGGKEEQNELGIDWIDVTARNYDPAIGRWMNIDPLAEDFNSWSPYNFNYNDPIRFIDPTGMGPEDIIVLAHAKRDDDPEASHLVGHQAILVGDDKNGWYYYSYDYDEGANGRSSKENKSSNDNFTAGVYFSSIEEFANSEYNTFKDDYDDGKGLETSHKDEEGNIIQRFDEGYRIDSDPKTDEKMKVAANKTFDEKYNICTGNQCTRVVRNALNAGGFNNGEDNKKGNNGIWDGLINENIFPISKQKAIEKFNKGTDIDKQLKRR